MVNFWHAKSFSNMPKDDNTEITPNKTNTSQANISVRKWGTCRKQSCARDHEMADIRPTYRTHVLNVLLVRLNRYPSIRISELLAGSSDVELIPEELKSCNKQACKIILAAAQANSGSMCTYSNNWLHNIFYFHHKQILALLLLTIH